VPGISKSKLHSAHARVREKYEGGFWGDKYHGHGKMTSADGIVFVGAFENGSLHGAAVQTMPGCQPESGRWVRGIMQLPGQ
jgi:hypothetical protein